jgi:hypothetical protein
MVSEIPVDGFAAMNTEDDVSHKQSILAAQAAAVQAVEEAKASPLPHRQRMLFNSKETWQLTGRKIRNQRVHCQGIRY